MAEEPRTLEELKQWQRDYKQVVQQWIVWLRENATAYGTAEDAWRAFKRQWSGTVFIPE